MTCVSYMNVALIKSILHQCQAHLSDHTFSKLVAEAAGVEQAETADVS